ncbi:MAG TPA: cytochrome C oxidase subunit IV family protein [Candidatus Binataceae bacterium]|nr:cytochrome C oxidase subunit IV family protein [Candidatus Binataceae bacterium]
MNDPAYAETEHAHVSNTVYLIVGGFLLVLTAMEVTVSYLHALRPVMVPLLVVLALAKFALIALFFMHLRYEKWTLNTMFGFPLVVATVVFVALFGLFLYLSRHLVGPAYPIHYFGS